MRSLCETLDSIVSVAVRETLVSEALSLSGLPAVPEDLRSFSHFVQRAMRQTLVRALGPELGSSVIVELERLVTEKSLPVSARRPSQAAQSRALPTPASALGEGPRSGNRPEARPTRSDVPRAKQRVHTLPAGAVPSEAPPSARSTGAPEARIRELPQRRNTYAEVTVRPARPPSSGDFPSGTANLLGMVPASGPPTGTPSSARRLPLIFIATREAELVRSFSMWLDPRAAVVRVTRIIDVLLDLEDAGERRAVIVLDGQSAPFRVEALAAVAEELPDTVRIVLWAVSPEQCLRLCEISPLVASWTCCPQGAPLAEVAERCADAVG
ncbi:MAG TPA: hypothetical protein VER33_20950 [Polyangiaceae bacterium]|nr:hypothetical protein [Polyangiaceae bacterium]